MALTLDRNDTIAGYRPAIFKQALRRYALTQNAGNLVDLKSLFANRRDGAIVFEECLDRGLIDRASLKRTDAGEHIARAKAKPRTPIARADAILEQLLDRAVLMNACPDGLSLVDEIWLFGSVLRRAETVGDIDLAMTCSRILPDSGGHDAYQARVEDCFERAQGTPQGLRYYWEKEDWLRERSLFGKVRHPLLAGVQDGFHDLASLAVPCRLVFDRQRGGRVDDPILERHPTSTGRTAGIGPAPQSVDLTPDALKPMDGRWVAGFKPWGTVCPPTIFRSWSKDARRVFARYPQHLRIFADGYQQHNFPWVPKALKRGGIDGRSLLLVTDAIDRWGVSVVLSRRIEIADDKWTLHAKMVDVELHHARTVVDLESLPPIVGAIALILAADAEHMVRRAAELPTMPAIAISLKRTGLVDMLQSFLIDQIHKKIRSRAVAVEPDGFGRIVSIKRV